MSETSLYSTVKRFLEAAGDCVKGEVAGCGVVAVRDGDPASLIVVEMKLGFSLELPLQAVNRARAADERWLACQPHGGGGIAIGACVGSAE
jgi:hypothetical protein